MKTILPLGLFCLCLFFVSLSKADTVVTTNDLVAFFKQAISSPPDIEEFIAGQRSSPSSDEIASLERIFGKQAVSQMATNTPTFQFFQGARAGNNYYLRQIPNSNSPNMLAPSGFIAGRAGANVYQFTKDSVAYGLGTNGFVTSVNSFFYLLCEFLNMGLGDIKPDSVVWSDNHFTAMSYNGVPRYGHLNISNQ